MVMRIDTRVDLGAVGRCRFARCKGVCGKDAGKLDFELDDTILVHNPVNTVFVVAGSEDLADDQFASAGSGGGLVTWEQTLVHCAL